jgi:hypothetical protein
MSVAEIQRKIEAAVQEAMNRALGELRAQLTERLRHSQDDVLGYLSAVDFSKAVPPIPADLLAPEPAPRPEPGEVLASVLGPVRAIDAARSQADILRTLLRTSGPFAARAAILLLDETEVRFWEGRAIQRAAGSSLGHDEIGALDRLRLGRGVVELSGTDAASFGAFLGMNPGAAGQAVLVPLVLRDKIAGALYADRQGNDEAFEPLALQLLTYITALALETLAFRQRPATPTLTSFGQTAAAGLGVWSTARIEAEVAAEPVAPPPLITQPPEPGPEPAPRAAAPTVEPSFEDSLPSGQKGWTAAPELVPPPAAVEPAVPAVTERQPEKPAPGFGPGFGTVRVPAFSPVVPEPVQPAATAYAPQPTKPVQVEPPPTPVVPLAPSPATAPIDLSEQDTLLLPRRPSSLPTSLPPTPKAPELPRPAAPLATGQPVAKPAAKSSEVKPPLDLRGPGWAFSQASPPALGTTDAQQDEARRLARLLVSEIKLYNEDQVELGRRNLDLYKRLREDIDRSRQMYEDRVDAKVRASSDYFQQELVRILAGGDVKALGL